MVAISTLDISIRFEKKKFFLLYFFILFFCKGKQAVESFLVRESGKEAKIESIFPDHPLCLISLEFYVCLRERANERQHEDLMCFSFSLFNNITTQTPNFATPQSNPILYPSHPLNREQNRSEWTSSRCCAVRIFGFCYQWRKVFSSQVGRGRVGYIFCFSNENFFFIATFSFTDSMSTSQLILSASIIIFCLPHMPSSIILLYI